MSAGSGSRPGPESGPVSRPTAGGRTTAPRRRSVATLSCVAGCSHISVCIAGTNTTGQEAVRRVAVSRSSARPAAARASRSAVAGGSTTRTGWGPGPAGGGGGRRGGGGGGDHDKCGVLSDPDGRALGHLRPDGGGDGFAGERLKGGSANEVQPPGGGDDGDVAPRLGERAQQEGGL